MLEKITGFVQKHKTKAAVAVGTAAAAMGSMAPVAFAADTSSADISSSLVGRVDTFINGILTPVAAFCTSNGICLMFLTATFIKLGVGILRRSISAFGRGR